jgi:hypothetical protein
MATMKTPIQRVTRAAQRTVAKPTRGAGVLPPDAFGGLPASTFGVIIPGLTATDVVKVGGFSLASRPIAELIPVPRGVETEVQVIRGDIARGLRVELRRPPSRVVQLEDMVVMSRPYSGTFPGDGLARVDFHGFEVGSVIYLRGERVAIVTTSGPFPVRAPTGSTSRIGVVAPDGSVREGSFSARPGDLFEVFPTDLSLATQRPWYLPAPVDAPSPSASPSPSPSASPSPSPSASSSPAPSPSPSASPSPSPSASPSPSPSASSSPAPSPSPSASPSPSPSASPSPAPSLAPAALGVLIIVPGVPNAFVRLDGTSLAGPPYRVELPQGSYVLQVAAEGYEPRELAVDAVAGQVAEVRVPLARRRSTAGLAGAALAALMLSGGIYAILRWTQPDDRMERADNPSRDRSDEREWVLTNLAKLFPGIDWRRAKVSFVAGSWVRRGHPRWEVIAGDLVVRSWEPVSRSGGLRTVTWVGHNYAQVEVISGATRASQKRRPSLGTGRA